MTATTDLSARRLDLAGARGSFATGAGPARRAALDELVRDRLLEVWAQGSAGTDTTGVALAAVGSLARHEAGPLSDVDLVLLHLGRTREHVITDLADRLWYPLWDGGIRLDHAVRTPTQCRKVASADLTAAVGLLDLDLVAGDPDVVAGARSGIAHDWRGAARSRLPQLLAALSARHERHGDVGQSLEPDLKEARGGLRDLTVIRSLTEAWLAERPPVDLDAARATLLDVRDALHVVTGRGRERLLRDEHDAVAALLGYGDPDDLLADIAGAGRTIAYALDVTVRAASRARDARTLRVGPRRPRLTPLGFGAAVSDGEVVLAGRGGRPGPVTPLRVARLAARQGLPVAPRTLANLAELPAPDEPWSTPVRDAFTDLLATGPGLPAVWEGLDHAGLIERWLPEWNAIRSRPQRSAVHRHTVDRHSIEAVVRAGGLVRRVARPDVLLVATLLHDIGKVAGQRDHSLEGAPVAARVAERMGFEPADVATVTRLVREHLTLVDLATRRSHDDAATVRALLEAVDGDPDTLDLLAALTEADASSAGPQAWSTWRAGLVDDLVRLAHAELAGVAPAHVSPGAPSIDDDLPADVLEPLACGEPVVRVEDEGSGHRVEVYDRDRLGLFADTAGLLTAYGLLVRRAELRTLTGAAADTWWVESPNGEAPDPAELTRSLRRLTVGDRTPLRRLERRQAAPDLTAPPARALVVPGGSDDATVLEVRAADRPGLLHDIGLALATSGLSVRAATVATYAGQSLDTFYVTEWGGGPLTPARTASVVGALIDACG